MNDSREEGRTEPRSMPAAEAFRWPAPSASENDGASGQERGGVAFRPERGGAAPRAPAGNDFTLKISAGCGGAYALYGGGAVLPPASPST